MNTLLRDIFESVAAAPGRYVLAAAAIAVGCFALTLLVAVLGSLHRLSTGLVQEFGANSIALVSTAGSQDSDRTRRGQAALSVSHLSAIRQNFPHAHVASVRRSTTTTHDGNALLTVLSTDEAFANVRDMSLVRGRFLDRYDVQTGARNAVISHALSQRWGWATGDVILLKTMPFTIVGTVNITGEHLAGQFGDPNLLLGDSLILVPMGINPVWAQQPVVGKDGLSRIDAVYVRPSDKVDGQKMLAAMQRLLMQPGLRVAGVSWITTDTLLASVTRMQRIVTVSVGGIAILCLMLGGTTLMSLLLANIRDRIPEIGLRRAIGASKKAIAGLFITEGILVTAVGSIIGTLAGCTALVAFKGHIPFVVTIDFATWMGPVVATILLSLAFTWLPASTAAGIIPADALRYE